eukprot:m.397154 g.397154  ORF g.397154 m.397154 type:complete len:79 (-) comp21124_c0_seq2:77-313(-)
MHRTISNRASAESNMMPQASTTSFDASHFGTSPHDVDDSDEIDTVSPEERQEWLTLREKLITHFTHTRERSGWTWIFG